MNSSAPVSCGPCATQCSRCGRGFDTGEGIWSALVGGRGAEKARQRIDFCQGCWTGPGDLQNEGVVCWFRAVCNRETMGSLAQSREQILMATIKQMSPTVTADSEIPADPALHQAFRYAAALGLWRMQRLRLDQVTDKDGREVLRFRITGTQKRFEVINPGLAEEELRKMEEELIRKAQEDLRLSGSGGYSPQGDQAA